ncbi:hypothetical protein [Aquimarina aggregata]|uniref:hypothetical protein n=1 Tax=Aquimarina aggregata TaxID=1642818 RepID=UPI0024929176|nr:hypothetical protein [Aquimarina aggregata]
MIFTIKSNDGWQVIEFIQKQEVELDGKLFFLFQLCLKADFWNREEMLKDEFNELKTDKIIKYEQLLISNEKWNTFLEKIEGWKKNGELFTFDLYNKTGDFMTIGLNDSSEELMASFQKPIFSIIIKDSRTKLEFKMLIDNTSFSQDSSDL